MSRKRVMRSIKFHVKTFSEAYEKPSNLADWIILIGVVSIMLGLYYTLYFIFA